MACSNGECINKTKNNKEKCGLPGAVGRDASRTERQIYATFRRLTRDERSSRRKRRGRSAPFSLTNARSAGVSGISLLGRDGASKTVFGLQNQESLELWEIIRGRAAVCTHLEQLGRQLNVKTAPRSYLRGAKFLKGFLRCIYSKIASQNKE